ncbi:hypothetical protein Ahy_A07g033516 [Arachis hypogaea]|uniref:Replication factor A C-terminal domain-containing protein n=1 Tax=Arachis hypogaea TaxID=3818 RepID=A0A445C9R3_ARAHY|nr:hypothetical protein Ahy_A07g033516 [Arachis hypogaea]
MMFYKFCPHYQNFLDSSLPKGNIGRILNEVAFLKIYQGKTIEQLKELDTNVVCVVLATISHIIDTPDWWYGQCECNRYRIKLSVIDDSDCAYFVIFDKEAKQNVDYTGGLLSTSKASSIIEGEKVEGAKPQPLLFSPSPHHTSTLISFQSSSNSNEEQPPPSRLSILHRGSSVLLPSSPCSSPPRPAPHHFWPSPLLCFRQSFRCCLFASHRVSSSLQTLLLLAIVASQRSAWSCWRRSLYRRCPRALSLLLFLFELNFFLPCRHFPSSLIAELILLMEFQVGVDG